MQQIYWRTPMAKCDFNKVALHFEISVNELLGFENTLHWM